MVSDEHSLLKTDVLRTFCGLNSAARWPTLAGMEHEAHLLTPDELGQILSMPASWVAARARAGEIPGFKLGREWRFDRDQVAEWLTFQGNPPTRRDPSRSILPSRGSDASKHRAAPVDLETAINAEDVAEEFGVPLVAVKSWIPSVLPGVRVGRRYLVDWRALDRFRQIVGAALHLERLPPGRARTIAVREAVQRELLRRQGIVLSLHSWERQGGTIPHWSDVFE